MLSLLENAGAASGQPLCKTCAATILKLAQINYLSAYPGAKDAIIDYEFLPGERITLKPRDPAFPERTWGYKELGFNASPGH